MYYNRAAFLVVAILIMIAGLASIALSDSQPSGITVTGTASVQGTPDIAYISVGVVNQDADAAKAAQANAATTNAVITAIFNAGIAKPDIQTQNYSISPVMDYKADIPTTVGYRVSNEVRVKVKDLSKIGSLIDVAAAAGANNISGVNFSIENDTPLRQKAMVQALKNAEAKAKTIAETMGVKLGKVTAITESSSVIPPPVTYGGLVAKAAPTPIMPGELQITSTVTVIYSIL